MCQKLNIIKLQIKARKGYFCFGKCPAEPFVVQWTEQSRPKGEMWVRFLPKGLLLNISKIMGH